MIHPPRDLADRVPMSTTMTRTKIPRTPSTLRLWSRPKSKSRPASENVQNLNRPLKGTPSRRLRHDTGMHWLDILPLLAMPSCRPASSSNALRLNLRYHPTRSRQSITLHDSSLPVVLSLASLSAVMMSENSLPTSWIVARQHRPVDASMSAALLELARVP